MCVNLGPRPLHCGGRRCGVALRILLTIAGVLLSLLPGLPAVHLPPELVLLLVLPPLIYSAAVAMSWREFRFNLRPIALLAIGCVVFTTVAAAAVAHWLRPIQDRVGCTGEARVAQDASVKPGSGMKKRDAGAA